MKLRVALLALVIAVAFGVGQSQATITPVALTFSESSPYLYVDTTGPTVYHSASGGVLTVNVNDTTDSAPLTVDFPSLFGDDPAPSTSTSHPYTANSSDSGPKTVDLSDAGADTDSHAFTLTQDTTAPSGQTVALSGGPNYATLSVPLTLGSGTDAGAGVDTSSGVVERDSATLTGGTCGSFSGTFALVPLVGGADTSVVSGNCYRYQYKISDRVGNQSTASAPSADAKVNAVVPIVTDTAPTELTGAGDQFWNSATDILWFRPAAAGSFTLNATATDAVSGITKVDFPDVSAVTGWSGSNGGADTASPYASPVAYTWTAGATAPGARQVIGTNGTGVTGTDTITMSADSTAPSGQSVVLGGGPWYSSEAVLLTLGQGTDAGSGVDSTRSVLERASAPLTNGVCGTFGTFAAVTLTAGADTGVASGNCYRYQYKTADNVGNVSTPSAASADAKVDTSTPTVPSLIFTGFTNTASSANVVYYRPKGTGSFTVSAAASDGESGIASYAFPTLTGFTAAGSGPRRTYTFSNVRTAPRGPLAVSATNGAGLSSATSFTLVGDATPPKLTVRCNGKPCLKTMYKKAVMVTARATDAGGSGVATIRYTIDGSNPTADRGAEYLRGITVRSLARFKIRAYDKAGNASITAFLRVRSAADRLVFAAPSRVNVKAGAGALLVKVTTTRRSIVVAAMSGPNLKHPKRWRFILDPGTSLVRFQLPTGLAKEGRYALVWSVQSGTQKTRRTTRIVFRLS